MLSEIPAFSPRSRIMLISPHPDDESLACSIILQRAVRAGAAIRIIYATDGDNNPWPQRVLHRKWRLTPADRAKWGRIRRQEAYDALNMLGVRRNDVEFLGLPDQGITKLLLIGCEPMIKDFTRCLWEWAPTDLFLPDITDIHPDHSALGVMLRTVLERLRTAPAPHSVWNFLVHWRTNEFPAEAVPLEPTTQETLGKLRAINCHKTQLKLSRGRFTRYANRPEHFTRCQFGVARMTTDLIRLRDGRLVLSLPPPGKALLRRQPRLLIFAAGAAGDSKALYLSLNGRTPVMELFDGATKERVGLVNANGSDAAELKLAFPKGLFSSAQNLFLKLEHRGIFFDRVGWMHAGERNSEIESGANELPIGFPSALSSV